MYLCIFGFQKTCCIINCDSRYTVVLLVGCECLQKLVRRINLILHELGNGIMMNAVLELHSVSTSSLVSTNVIVLKIPVLIDTCNGKLL